MQVIQEEKKKILSLVVTAAFLCGDCERTPFMELPQEDPRSSDPNLVERLIKPIRDAQRPAAVGEACREDLLSGG